jgi:hypothetical protein
VAFQKVMDLDREHARCTCSSATAIRRGSAGLVDGGGPYGARGRARVTPSSTRGDRVGRFPPRLIRFGHVPMCAVVCGAQASLKANAAATPGSRAVSVLSQAAARASPQIGQEKGTGGS